MNQKFLEKELLELPDAYKQAVLLQLETCVRQIRQLYKTDVNSVALQNQSVRLTAQINALLENASQFKKILEAEDPEIV